MPREGSLSPVSLSPVSIRRARATDAGRLAELEEAIFPGDQMSRRRFAALASRPSALILAARVRREIVGYAILLTRRGIRSARLYALAVAPAAAGRGIGRALLAKVEASARRRGARRLHLEVRADNRRAIRLYQSAGYTLIGERDDYYADGMAALLFSRDLPPARPRKLALRRAA